MGSRTAGALVALVGVALASEASGQPLRIAWSDAHELVSDRAAVEREVARLLADTGLDISWAEGPSAAAARAPRLEVNVVISPSDPSGDGWNLSPTAMGVYLKSESSSAVFVFHERVARVLGVSIEGPRKPSDSRALGRAVGRVVVHELVHRIAPALAHAEAGVFRADLGRDALTRRRLALDERSRRVLVSAVMGSRARTARVRRER
jgi:hypothetical protein